MAETRWTDEQLSAINTRDKTLLVSAAAGSGKTATLTERIIHSLTDPTSPMNIDSILIVTFTKAAAGELRAKISRALSKAVEENPENEHLKKQLYLLPSAKIRTIDSFCNEILRANCDRVGLNPGFRIADGAECELLAISILEGLIEAVYNGDLPEIASPAEFEELADCLTDSGKTEELSGVLRLISLKCDNAEDGIGLLGRMIESYNCKGKAVEDTLYGGYLMDLLREMADHYLPTYESFERAFSLGDDAERKYYDIINGEYELLKRLHSASSYDEAREAILGHAFPDLPIVRKGKTPLMEDYQLRRAPFKADLKGMQEHFLYTSEEWTQLYSSLYRVMSVLYRFECKFDELFTEEKRRLGALSFNDVSRYTYKCLVKDGEITDIARNVASQFDAIYIDEYQDVNKLQNSIFGAISRPDNRFMVGDIKQSIYVFRSACPDIFASMKKEFPLLKDAVGDQASIFMSKNFRCDRGIVDFVNNIFDKAFTCVKESIGYVPEDRLQFAKKYDFPEPEYKYPTLCMLDKNGPSSPDAVAAKIAELLDGGKLNDGRPIRPSDIAIIIRNTKDRDVKYAEALERQGIPSCISAAKDFFLSPEVLLALCLLNSIDNPRRDIYLAGLMCSPLFDFTAEELYLIRECGGATLYESLLAYTGANPDYAKGISFLNTLEHYRFISEGIGVDTLIQKLYRETGLMSLASRSGGKDNLTLLYDYARSFESGSFKGLYNFISFINNIIDRKTTFDDTRARTGVDAVKIITAHSSKGLEYPIVFCVETNAQIYDKERNTRLAFCEDFGIAFRLRTPSGLALANNPVYSMVRHKIDLKIYEEDLRILYVVLTRARERLFIVGKCPNNEREKYDQKIALVRENFTPYAFKALSTYQDVISACEGSRWLDTEEFCGLTEADENTELEQTEGEEPVEKTVNTAISEELTRRFTYKYPSPHLTTLPEKMSVSAMSPTVLDGSEDDPSIFASLVAHSEWETEDEGKEKRSILPVFASGGTADESAKRGIATHLFMQFCNLELLTENGAAAELSRLVDSGFISPEDKERVRIDEIELFCRSNLLTRMTSAEKIYRELRFNVYLPAASFTTEDEKKAAYADRDILVQGVIDCIIVDRNGEITLCDYKTDRLSRAELADYSLAEKVLREKHTMQLSLYSLAIEKIFGKTPSKVEVYSLPLGDTISII